MFGQLLQPRLLRRLEDWALIKGLANGQDHGGVKSELAKYRGDYITEKRSCLNVCVWPGWRRGQLNAEQLAWLITLQNIFSSAAVESQTGCVMFGEHA